MTRAALLALLLLSSGCATLHSAADWWQQQQHPPAPPAEVAYIVELGRQECRDLSVPAWVEFTMTGKGPGTPEREEVVAWGFATGGDWAGGNGAPGTFTFRAHDSRPDWGKLKVYGLDAYAGEPPLRMAWAPAESYALRFAVDAGEVSWRATRASDGATADARQRAQTPGTVTICIGDPRTRKAALGARLTVIRWSGP